MCFFLFFSVRPLGPHVSLGRIGIMYVAAQNVGNMMRCSMVEAETRIDEIAPFICTHHDSSTRGPSSFVDSGNSKGSHEFTPYRNQYQFTHIAVWKLLSRPEPTNDLSQLDTSHNAFHTRGLQVILRFWSRLWPHAWSPRYFQVRPEGFAFVCEMARIAEGFCNF